MRRASDVSHSCQTPSSHLAQERKKKKEGKFQLTSLPSPPSKVPICHPIAAVGFLFSLPLKVHFHFTGTFWLLPLPLPLWPFPFSGPKTPEREVGTKMVCQIIRTKLRSRVRLDNKRRRALEICIVGPMYICYIDRYCFANHRVEIYTNITLKFTNTPPRTSSKSNSQCMQIYKHLAV